MKKLLTLLAAAAITQTANAQTGVVNVKGDLDNWRTYNVTQVFPPSITTLDAPVDWYSSDTLIFGYGPLASPGHTFTAQLSKETASTHAGGGAAKLTTEDQGPDLGVLPCILSNAKMDLDLSNFDPADPFASLTFEGGTPVTERINVVSAWVKYTPVNADKAFFYAEAIQGSNTIGEGDVEIQATANYTKLTITMNYSQTGNPDKLRIFFASSDPNNAQDGSILLVDDVEAIGASGVRTPLFKNNVVKVYPVPAHGSLNLASSKNQPLVWQAYSVDGKLVASTTFTGNTSVNISHMPAGLYSYTVSEINGIAVQTGKFNVQ
jgi:hypothetical protein